MLAKLAQTTIAMKIRRLAAFLRAAKRHPCFEQHSQASPLRRPRHRLPPAAAARARQPRSRLPDPPAAMQSALRAARAPRHARGLAAEPSLLWKMAHGAFDPVVPMTSALPGVRAPADLAPPATGETAVTTLPNGVRVASQDNGGTVAAVGVYVGAGSRHETPHTAGATHLLEHCAFKGSAARSKYRMTRDVERAGAGFSAAASRETLAYAAECMRGSAPEVVSILTESATSPAVAVEDESSVAYGAARSEIDAHVAAIKGELKEYAADPAGRVTEAVHAAAYHGNTLGLPLVAETRKLDALSPRTVSEFMRDTLAPNRIVVAAANMSHDELVALAEVGLGSLPAGAAASDAPALYTGGSIRIAGDGPGHVAIGFNGVSWSDADLIPVCVLHTLLGGGGSFSSGGPGKGMYTRLFSDILNRHGWVSSAVAFNHCYSDTGLFGIHASCGDPAHLNNLIEVVGAQVGKMSGPLAKDELSRAKSMTKSSLLMNLESRAVVCEDIGRQILGSGKYVGAADLCAAIDKLDEGDIRRVAAKMLESKPSLVIHGEEYATHAYEAIEGSIKSQIAA